MHNIYTPAAAAFALTFKITEEADTKVEDTLDTADTGEVQLKDTR